MKHIVIIEDDAFILDTMSILLESEGYKVTGYSNGSVILDNELEMPDLLIVDRQLPGIDGITLCRKFKSEPLTKNIPVILMSASSDIEQLAQDALADGSLEKPFKADNLFNMLASLLKSS
ncbi:response regulator transcription factor [Foetidibacter luteolus]|uniref:response regulator transcription factor n=2 Tax=Foetidibacter luteolus TaxID=2608880 RepID=UPI00129A1A93|nr:response regulator [Foetidibacter luteolus]